MIRYLTQEQIDKDLWDECIRNAFNGMIYGYSWYLDIVAGQWDALVENDYERVFPLTWRKRAGIFYLHQPFFTQQLGIFSRSILTDEVAGQFVSAIPGKFRLVEINMNQHNKLTTSGIDVLMNRNHELDLIDSYEHLHKRYSQNLTRTLRKAGGNSLSLSRDIRPDEVIELFRQHRGRTVSTLKKRDYQCLRRLIYTLIYKGKAQVWGVYTAQNELAAGAFFVFSHRKSIFLFSGTSSQGRETGAMSFLIDRFIDEHAQTHLTLDFEGSNDPGLARFYKSFGSRETFYPSIRINRIPFPARWLVTSIKKTRRIIDTSPGL